MEQKRHYTDFFYVPEDYKASMTRENINETPETWLQFYPHAKYVDFLQTLLGAINGGARSVWLTGNYGTGKSFAALVTQKLFMDDEARVRGWFTDCKNALADGETLQNDLLARRGEGTLVVYDYNAQGLGPDDGLLVRLEQGIIAALNENNMTIPAKANLDEMIVRLREEGANFFKTRDEIQDRLAYLNTGIKTTEQLIDELNKPHKPTDAPVDLLGDVQKVFHARSIYLGITVERFSTWINEILKANNLRRVVYIFDEFSDFIETNKEHLKTFEEVSGSENAVGKFYLVPVTHRNIKAYESWAATNAKQSNDRFYFRNLQMPNDIAFQLAAHAMKGIQETSGEWEIERDKLWSAVASIADTNFDASDVSRKSFYDILPIHPMAAFLLKFLAESARSNQRSIFEYLKGSADGREFQDFIRRGGPGIKSKQFLTVDYLWKYFIEREDLGLSKEVISIRSEYDRIKGREFQNREEDDEDIRVLKVVLLFCLLSRLTPDGHERLKPTVQNIELSFQGDGAIVNVSGIIKSLADKHCFSVVNGNIELFATSVGGAEIQKKVGELEGKFHDLLSGKVEEEIKNHIKSLTSSFSAGRFEIRVSDLSHTTLTNIYATTRDRYSTGLNKDNGAVCLWFVIAKNREEQLQIPEKIKSLLNNLRDHRILMFALPNLSFCDSNAELWDEYILQYAQYMLENDSAARTQRQKAYEKIEREWFDEIKKSTQVLKVYSIVDGQVIPTNTSWNTLKSYVSDYVRRVLPCCVDYLIQYLPAFGNSGLNGWAKSGIMFDNYVGTFKQLINSFKASGITGDVEWFGQNPTHPLAEIRDLFEKKIANTIGKRSELSIRKVYIELQRAPYGMKYNALSAFVLGFVLKDIVARGYQWDNNQKTGSLDFETLAAMIEEVVKDDGNDKIKLEKLICRLSKEDKAFIEKAPAMFGISSAGTSGRVEDALLLIQNRVEKVSGRVPLWVLTEYLESVCEPQVATIKQLLDNICLAGSTSSKSGKTDQRSNAIKDVGKIILENNEIITTISGYIKPENFETAFQIYIDKNAPALKALAESVGDISYGYCQAIKEKTAESAGLLWNKTDIASEIAETEQEYEVIKPLKPIIGFEDFVPYRTAIETLRNAVISTNRLPKTLIESAVPALSVFLSNLGNNGNVSAIKESLSQNIDIIKKLFFDVTRAKSLELLKVRLSGVTISDAELLNIYNGLSSGYASDEATFLNDLRSRIEEYAKESVVQNLKEEWKRFSNENTPAEWAINSRIPARYLFNGIAEADDIISAVQTPGAFSSDKLGELLDVFKGLSPLSIAECQSRFVADVVPKRYAKLNINLPSLLGFLKSEYGTQPNNWQTKPDIQEFIRSQYKDAFAPQVTEKIKKTSPDILKQKLLQLAQDNPELGLLFWE